MIEEKRICYWIFQSNELSYHVSRHRHLPKYNKLCTSNRATDYNCYNSSGRALISRRHLPYTADLSESTGWVTGCLTGISLINTLCKTGDLSFRSHQASKSSTLPALTVVVPTSSHPSNPNTSPTASLPFPHSIPTKAPSSSWPLKKQHQHQPPVPSPSHPQTTSPSSVNTHKKSQSDTTYPSCTPPDNYIPWHSWSAPHSGIHTGS